STRCASSAARSAGADAERAALDAQRVLLLDRLHRLDGRDVALGERADRVVAVAALERAGARRRILVEDERPAPVGRRPADVAVVAPTLEIAGHAAGEGARQRAHH